MNRNRHQTCRWVCAGLGIAAVLFPLGSSGIGAFTQSDDPGEKAGTESNLALQLENCRQGLSDAQVRPEDRKRWAQLLFTLEAVPARNLIREILATGHAAAQLAICETIAERTRNDPAAFDPGWIDLLLERLGSEDRALRLAAAAALSEHHSEELAKRLGDLAASDTASEVSRMAAVESLAMHIDRRSHVAQLIRLLEVPFPEIVEKIYSALEPTTRKSLGRDVARWKEWWERKEKLSEEAWLLDWIGLYADRLSTVERELDLARDEHTRQMDAMRGQMIEFQRDVHRMAGVEERSSRLIQWLSTPLSEVRLTALSIIQGRIADDGRPPEGPLRDAIMPLLADPSVAVRRQTLLILQNMSDPAVAEAVRARLPHESDPATRATLLKSLGRLISPEAVPALVQEAANAEADPTCVREAILALGEIAAKVDDPAMRERIATALLSRHRRLGSEETLLRAVILVAMASAADPQFKLEFEEGLNSTNPDILRPAIRGVKALRLAATAPRLRTLTSDGDPLIRSAAIDALGHLGTEDADVECLLTRLNQTIESNEDVRECAWRAFREWVKRRPVPHQLALAQRLPEVTDLQLRFLEQFVVGIEGQVEHEATLDPAYQRIAALLSAKQRFVESSACLKKLYDLRAKQPHGKSAEAAVLWLSAALRTDRESDAVATISVLAATPERVPAEEVLTTVRTFLENHPNGVPEHSRKMLEAVRQAVPESPTPFWRDLIDLLDVKVRAGSADAQPLPTPAG